MGKVIRINNKNIQYIEELRELFAKVKIMKNIYWDDNKIISIALTNMILDYKREIEINKHTYFD